MESCMKSKSSEKAPPLSRLKAGQRGVIVSIKSGRETDLQAQAFGLTPVVQVLLKGLFLPWPCACLMQAFFRR